MTTTVSLGASAEVWYTHIMTLEALHKEWATDQELSFDQPDKILRGVPFLHSKWWNIYTIERQRFIAVKQEHDTLRRARFEWYLGRLDDAERIQRGWEHQPVRIVRQEVETYLSSDALLMPFAGKLETLEIKLKFLEDVIKNINGRGYLVSTYVNGLKFSQGS